MLPILRSSIYLLPLLLSLTAGAQHRRDADTGRNQSMIDKHMAIYVGMPFGDFKATTPEGSVFTNTALSGKVSLILFWYPTIGSVNGELEAKYLRLKTPPDLISQHKDFQVISLLADTADLALFRRQHPDVNLYQIGNLKSHSAISRLSPFGVPSCMLIDRYGKIAWYKGLHNPDEQELADKVRELLLQ